MRTKSKSRPLNQREALLQKRPKNHKYITIYKDCAAVALYIVAIL